MSSSAFYCLPAIQHLTPDLTHILYRATLEMGKNISSLLRAFENSISETNIKHSGLYNCKCPSIV